MRKKIRAKKSKTPKELSLLRVYCKKEKLFWVRTWKGIWREKASIFTKLCSILLVAFVHYGAMLLSVSLELLMGIFDKKQFGKNMVYLYDQAETQLDYYKNLYSKKRIA